MAAFIGWQKVSIGELRWMSGSNEVWDHQRRTQNLNGTGIHRGRSDLFTKKSVPEVWGFGAGLPRTAHMVA